MLRAVFVLPVFAVGALCASAVAMPLNPAVTQQTIHSTICVPGWTKTVRPPVRYTNRIKRAEMDAAGIPWSSARSLELDHAIPLTIGGAPADAHNLRLQTWAPHAPASWKHKVDEDARLKDKLEVRLNRLVCAGELPLEEAQRCIWSDWRACLKRFPPHLKGQP